MVDFFIDLLCFLLPVNKNLAEIKQTTLLPHYCLYTVPHTLSISQSCHTSQGKAWSIMSVLKIFLEATTIISFSRCVPAEWEANFRGNCILLGRYSTLHQVSPLFKWRLFCFHILFNTRSIYLHFIIQIQQIFSYQVLCEYTHLKISHSSSFFILTTHQLSTHPHTERHTCTKTQYDRWMVFS